MSPNALTTHVATGQSFFKITIIPQNEIGKLGIPFRSRATKGELMDEIEGAKTLMKSKDDNSDSFV